ncbi:hypothetical protein TSUD_173540 [Trifolium subterraneum]|nr:hypothetical protein TSUD_173540 [Trifolium subterraneum]
MSVDIISTLPDAILCHILSFLDTEQSVATSILSKRWNPLWRSVTSIRFDTVVTNQISNFNFNDFVYSVLLSRDASLPINTFHLEVTYVHQCSIKSITNWVNFVVQRGVQYLYLEVVSNQLKLPITVLTCKTLVVLKLFGCYVEQGFSSVLLPSLKTLDLNCVHFPGLLDFMLFLTGCPILEDLLTSDLSFDNEQLFDSGGSLTFKDWESFFLCNLSQAYIDSFSYLKAVHNVQSMCIDINEVCL